MPASKRKAKNPLDVLGTAAADILETSAAVEHSLAALATAASLQQPEPLAEDVPALTEAQLKAKADKKAWNAQHTARHQELKAILGINGRVSSQEVQQKLNTGTPEEKTAAAELETKFLEPERIKQTSRKKKLKAEKTEAVAEQAQTSDAGTVPAHKGMTWERANRQRLKRLAKNGERERQRECRARKAERAGPRNTLANEVEAVEQTQSFDQPAVLSPFADAYYMLLQMYGQNLDLFPAAYEALLNTYRIDHAEANNLLVLASIFPSQFSAEAELLPLPTPSMISGPISAFSSVSPGTSYGSFFRPVAHSIREAAHLNQPTSQNKVEDTVMKPAPEEGHSEPSSVTTSQPTQ